MSAPTRTHHIFKSNVRVMVFFPCEAVVKVDEFWVSFNDNTRAAFRAEIRDNMLKVIIFQSHTSVRKEDYFMIITNISWDFTRMSLSVCDY